MTDRKHRMLLIISLTLNVFILGALAGGAFIWTRSAGDMPVEAAANAGGRLGLAAAALPGEQRRALRQALRETRRESRPLVEQSRAHRREARRLMSAELVDVAAVNAALARARAADIRLRGRLEERVVTFAATLPAEQREILAAALERRSRRERRK